MPAPHQRDYFAELYVAGIMGDAGWNVYFPKRDVGFDFIATMTTDRGVLLRPVQVKGLYPTEVKKDKTFYGYIGKLTQLHHDMVLALPYFTTDKVGPAPSCIAYMQRSAIRVKAGRGYKCTPAKFVSGCAQPRRDFLGYFDREGLVAVGRHGWGVGDV